MNSQTSLFRKAVKSLFLIMALSAMQNIWAAIDTSVYQPSTIPGILAEHGIDKELPKMSLADKIFVPPNWRYRLDIRVTGKILPVSSESRNALDSWGRLIRGLPEFASKFTHQVEIETENGPIWVMWQGSLVPPFLDELSNGGKAFLFVYFAGVFNRQPLFLVTVFQAADAVNSSPSQEKRKP